ncbi:MULTISPECIES: flagellar hook capping FlgD N-terminal domain-containing protein [unclassified Duganella]|uniref:flagellar hook capping FlgD N-terminal domain-containing protein n=1 Tax=unclassified Duganella TaxID=2636909 RepID=UPI000E357BAB|nr:MULTISPECIES: flagellar hook capping FlgD N-terminal domain-containing protein [unclassified Duganella]RFP18975.1 flagellar basal body rod modification protein [Duganella sp. BJB475]RFP35637.1 flagellar basal body rod modification protein [Duganella sp. BJB476]
MTVSLLNNGSSSGAAAGTSGNITGNSASATSDMFTKLLVAQIKNQDPLSPTDPAQFVQQLTQLSQTESLQNLSSLTSANASVLQSMQVLALGAQVGSDVMAETSTLTTDGATKVSGQMTLAATSTTTRVVLTGADGGKHYVNLGTTAAGTVPFAVDPTALGLPAGTYTMTVETSTKENPPVDLQGRLNSVRLAASGSVVLNVGNIGEVAPTAITAFNGKSTASATQSSL